MTPAKKNRNPAELLRIVLKVTGVVLIGFFLYPAIAQGQGGVPLWTNRYSGPITGNDRANAVAVDGSGNVIVTGFSNGGGSGYDYATIKYSSVGVPLWTNRYDGSGHDDQAMAVALDSSGNVFVTGSSASTTPTSYPPDYATIKYSSQGVPLWTNRYSSSGTVVDFANALAVDGSGNAIVTGVSGSDYATIKYSNAGLPLWTNFYHSGTANAIAVDANDDVFVTGSSATIKYSSAGVPVWTNLYSGGQAVAIAVDTTGDVVVTGNSLFDYATIKYSGAGGPLWTNRYEGSGTNADYATAVNLDGNGNVLVTGRSAGIDNTFDFATISYSGTGVPLWTNRYAAAANSGDEAASLAVDGNGNVFITGRSSSTGTSIGYDFVTIGYSKAGAPLWTNRLNGPGNNEDGATKVAVDGSGNVFVTGYSFGSASSWDYATIKYSSMGFWPIPLSFQTDGNHLVLSWTNTAFNLQSASSVTGIYTNISGATSPYTNLILDGQQYFRLKAD